MTWNPQRYLEFADLRAAAGRRPARARAGERAAHGRRPRLRRGQRDDAPRRALARRGDRRHRHLAARCSTRRAPRSPGDAHVRFEERDLATWRPTRRSTSCTATRRCTGSTTTPTCSRSLLTTLAPGGDARGADAEQLRHAVARVGRRDRAKRALARAHRRPRARERRSPPPEQYLRWLAPHCASRRRLGDDLPAAARAARRRRASGRRVRLGHLARAVLRAARRRPAVARGVPARVPRAHRARVPARGGRRARCSRSGACSSSPRAALNSARLVRPFVRCG